MPMMMYRVVVRKLIIQPSLTNGVLRRYYISRECGCAQVKCYIELPAPEVMAFTASSFGLKALLIPISLDV